MPQSWCGCPSAFGFSRLATEGKAWNWIRESSHKISQVGGCWWELHTFNPLKSWHEHHEPWNTKWTDAILNSWANFCWNFLEVETTRRVGIYSRQNGGVNFINSHRIHGTNGIIYLHWSHRNQLNDWCVYLHWSHRNQPFMDRYVQPSHGSVMGFTQL